MYAVSPAADALGATLNINGDTWFADTFQMRQYCGDLHGQGFLLVVGAGLFGQTFTSLTSQRTGVDRDRVLVVDIDDTRSSQATASGAPTLYTEIVAAIRALPGVDAVAFSAVTPFGNNTWNTVIENPAGRALSGEDRRVYKNEISPAWFRTYGISFIAGHDFEALDQTP
jgi:hypothetical protein